jgi:hypothetical protein
MDSGCSRECPEAKKWFSSLDLVIGKEYNTFEDKSIGKVVSHGSVQICISICFLFRNSLRMTMKRALKRACPRFWMLRGVLFVRFPLLVKFSVLIFHILLALLDVCW